MALQLDTFDDLLTIINTHPEWRRKLVKALFPEIDLPKALQELIESNRLLRAQLGDVDARLARLDERQARMEGQLLRLDERQIRMEGQLVHLDERQTRMEGQLVGMKGQLVGMEGQLVGMKGQLVGMKGQLVGLDERQVRMEGRQGTMDHRLDRIETTVTRLDRSVADLKGDNYESNFARKADAIFGAFLRRGHDGRQEIANRLEMADAANQISEDEYIQVMAADLLWNGRSKQLPEEISLVIEVSWFAESHDLDRAANRAAILRKIGLHAFPVVAAKEWVDALRSEALQRKIAIVHDYSTDKASWQSALQT